MLAKLTPGREISTHAPAGGATSPAYFFIPAPMYFYSRPCGRGDQYIGFYLLIVFQFLLTPLREGRQQFSTSPS